MGGTEPRCFLGELSWGLVEEVGSVCVGGWGGGCWLQLALFRKIIAEFGTHNAARVPLAATLPPLGGRVPSCPICPGLHCAVLPRVN